MPVNLAQAALSVAERLLVRVPNSFYDPDTGELFLRMPPVKRNWGLNIRAIYMVRAEDLRKNRADMPPGFDPKVAYRIYQEEGREGVDRYWYACLKEGNGDGL